MFAFFNQKTKIKSCCSIIQICVKPRCPETSVHLKPLQIMTDKNGTFRYETSINNGVHEQLSLGDVCCLCQLFDKLGDEQEVHSMTILVTQAIRSDCGFIQLFILLGPLVAATLPTPPLCETNLFNPGCSGDHPHPPRPPLCSEKHMNYKKKSAMLSSLPEKDHCSLKEQELKESQHTCTGRTSPTTPLRVSTWALVWSLQTSSTPCQIPPHVSMFSLIIKI